MGQISQQLIFIFQHVTVIIITTIAFGIITTSITAARQFIAFVKTAQYSFEYVSANAYVCCARRSPVIWSSGCWSSV